MLLVKSITFWDNIKYTKHVLNKLWNLDNNFFSSLSTFPSNPLATLIHTPHRDCDLGRDLSLRTTDVKGEFVLGMNESSKT
jgi:hypothetical protein